MVLRKYSRHISKATVFVSCAPTHRQQWFWRIRARKSSPGVCVVCWSCLFDVTVWYGTTGSWSWPLPLSARELEVWYAAPSEPYSLGHLFIQAACFSMGVCVFSLGLKSFSEDITSWQVHDGPAINKHTIWASLGASPVESYIVVTSSLFKLCLLGLQSYFGDKRLRFQVVVPITGLQSP